MTDITIPRETLEAAAMEMAPHPWSMYTDAAKEHFRDKARAALLAGLKAWPGMPEIIVGINKGSIILPPKEDSDV